MRSALRDRRSKRSLSPDSDTPKKSSSNKRGSYFFPRDSDEDSKPKTPEEGESPDTSDEKPDLPDLEKREAYEEMRKKNIEEKNQLLKLFGFTPLPDLVPPPVERTPVQKRAYRKTKRSPQAVPALRLTLRSRTKTGEVEVKKEEVEDEKEEEESEEEEIGDLKMVPINDEDDDKIKHEEYINNLLPHLSKARNTSGHIVDLDSYKKTVKQLQLRESSVKKVGVKRTFSMAIHPSESKVLVVTGDAIGNIGIWDVQSDAAPQVYHPHKAPVFCTSFCPTYSTRLYSTCIDGTVRRCDLDKLMFERVYVSKGRMAKNHTTWHCQRSSSELLVAHGNGSVGFIDMRSGEDSVQFYSCHDRSVRTVHVHPVDDQYFVTASGMGEVCIWDSRFIQKKSPKPVCAMPHSKGLKSAFFSPGGSLLLTTCNDDRLRIFNTENIQANRSQVVTTVIHNNQTGRWLTPFKAMWHPQRDDVFVVGSMDPHRAVDVYGIHGLLLRKMRDPLLTTILSVVQFHPSLDIIAGANSSGRVHVFMPSE